ncbi:MAG: hypothetical protein K0A90_04215 [Methanosarcinaceae archaeon]|nr:hypothetical protein [Methanosarcinaceae archaeon]
MSIEFHNKLINNPKLRLIYLISALIIIYFASWLPDFENVLGIEGARISSVAAFGPLNGMLLGPYWGAAISFFGIMAHFFQREFANVNTFSMLTPIFVMISSIVAGLIVVKKEKIALIIYSSLILLWYVFDAGREAYYYPWFHITILVLFVVFHTKYKNKTSNVGAHTLVLLFLTSLVAILSDHMAGSISALILFDLPAEIFESVVLIYPVERTILAIAAALVMFMLTAALQNILAASDEIDDTIENIKMNIMLDYVKNDVKPILKKQKKNE